MNIKPMINNPNLLIMVKHYIKRSALLLGAAAVAASASAGAYRDVTGQYVNDPAYLPGWQGALCATADGVGEVYAGAFNLYQTLPDMEAGVYTLKVDALYRCGWNEFAAENMKDGKLNYCYIYINGEKKAVKPLFEGRETAPNSTSEAAAAFAAGEYVNEITVNHPGGDMVVGIMNEGCYAGEWCCFDNFRLSKGSEDLTAKIKNAGFDEGLDAKRAWNNVNSANSEKTPDMNKEGGVYRKTNASPYNIGQQVELPAGKYRFSALTFFRYGGAGNFNGKYIACKGEWKYVDGQSPKDYYEGKKYDENNTTDNAYLYVSFNATKPANLDWDEELGELTMGVDKRVRIKDCWELNEGNYAAMPENETRAAADGTQFVPAYETRNVVDAWNDSGKEREAAAAFVAEPEKYRQYVEFELTAPAKVWIGIGKNENAPAQYWHPWADLKLEKWDENAQSGVADIVVEDENAPVEYYNLQGVRVANPENGLYIVKQGNKVSKKFIR